MGSEAVKIRYLSRIGERVGDLIFVNIVEARADGNRLRGLFKCDCGGQAIYDLGRVLNGKTRTHCGCKTDRGKSRTHGMRDSPEYSSWTAMKGRCLDPDNKDFPRWGGKGIAVCADWIASFEAFYAHIGPRPHGTSLDRIDNRRGYEPGNVRWATPTEQQRNRSTAYRWHIKGITFETADEAAAHFGVTDQTVHGWVKGRLDKRRNSFTPPRGDCHVEPRY
jgi:hypothetical protein